MDRIGGDVEKQLARFDGRGAMPRLLAVWPVAVGDEVARNSWPARVARDGTLHVHTSSSVWAFELGQLAPRILERLREELGGAAPKALRFVQGHLPEPAVASPEAVPVKVVAPTREAIERAVALAAGIEDEKLREQVEKAVSMGLSTRPDGRSL